MRYESVVTLKVDGHSSSDLLIRAANGDVVAFDGLPNPESYDARLSKILPRGVYVVEVAAHWHHFNRRGHSLEFRGEGIVAPDTHRLDGLAITDVNLAAFSTNVRDYARNVAADVAAVTVTPTAAQNDTVVRISPADSDPGTDGHQVALEDDGSTDIAVSVAHSMLAEPATAYTVALTQLAGTTSPLSADGSLSALSLTGIDFQPAFDPATSAYVATADPATGTVTVAATTTHSAAAAAIAPADADPATAGHQINLEASDVTVTVTVTVTAQDNTTNTYTITRPRQISGDATLSALAIQGAELTPAFDAAASAAGAHTAAIEHHVASTTVTATANHEGTRVVVSPVDADPDTAGHQVAVPEPASGETSAQTIVAVAVTAEDGTRKTYAVTVTRPVTPPPSGITMELPEGCVLRDLA